MWLQPDSNCMIGWWIINCLTWLFNWMLFMFYLDEKCSSINRFTILIIVSWILTFDGSYVSWWFIHKIKITRWYWVNEGLLQAVNNVLRSIRVKFYTVLGRKQFIMWSLQAAPFFNAVQNSFIINTRQYIRSDNTMCSG